MINFIVKILDTMLQPLRVAGIWVDEKTETYDYGKSGWCMNPDGNKMQLWKLGPVKF